MVHTPPAGSVPPPTLRRQNATVGLRIRRDEPHPQNSRSKYWVFTKNNPEYTDTAIQLLWTTMLAADIKYVSFQREIAPSTGTEHLQGYIAFKTRFRMSQVRQLPGLEGAHLEMRRGTADQARDYSRKDETRMAGTF